MNTLQSNSGPVSSVIVGMRLVLPVLFLLFLCCQSRKPEVCPEVIILDKWDSLVLFSPVYTFDTLFQVPPLTHFDSVITVHLGGGWGIFDYFAALYVMDGHPKYELFQYVDTEYFGWNDSLVKQSERGFTKIKKGEISMAEWSALLLFLDEMDYWCTPKIANPCNVSVDGKSWSLATRLGNRFHRVYWTDCDGPSNDTMKCLNRCPEMESIAMRVFKLAGFPQNQFAGVFLNRPVGNDSLSYTVTPLAFIPKTSVFCRGKLLLEYNITVSKKDKDWFNHLEIEDQYFDDTIRYVPKYIKMIK
ncbi:MAG: hypothetical protein IT261_14415 [Saprospiraceae bacterium]|nr:hypothetical protein [Saprospiraceae bacterium]